MMVNGVHIDFACFVNVLNMFKNVTLGKHIHNTDRQFPVTSKGLIETTSVRSQFRVFLMGTFNVLNPTVNGASWISLF